MELSRDSLTTFYITGNKKHLKHLKVRLKHLCFSFSVVDDFVEIVGSNQAFYHFNQSILSNYTLNSQIVNYRQFSQSDN